MERETYHTYIVLKNNYGIDNEGNVVQKGGDWYNIYTSKGEVKVSAQTIKDLVKKGLSAQQIETEGKKINDTFKLNGALILQRGTPFNQDVTFVQDDGRTNYENVDNEEINEELDSVMETLNNVQDKIKSLTKKVNNKKKDK